MASVDRVGIEVEVLGYDQAMSQMQSLEAELKGLGGHKARVRIEAEVEKLKLNRDALKATKVKLEADTKKVDSQIRNTKNQIKDLEKELERERNIQNRKGGLYNPNVERLRQNIARLKSELNQLTGERSDLKIRTGNVQAEINQIVSLIQRLQHALNNVKTMSLGQVFKSVSSVAAHIGSAMQSAGNALTRLTSPMRNFTTGAIMGAGYRALGIAKEGLTSGFSRYDTMTKYQRMMKEFEKGNYTAKKSVEELDASVQGLPTGLDEMVEMSQRFTLSLGDMKRGTDLAIATNNAFLASMATESQKYQGMLQLQDLMNGKKLQPREWMSLSASMGKAVNEVARLFGAETQEDIKEFRQQLNAGKIDSEEFLDALVKVGTGNGKIAKLAEESKNTWEAFTARVRTAFSRMTYGILTSLDELTKSMTGKTVNQLLDGMVIPAINKMTDATKAWIKAHPDEITDFFSALKNFDWKGLGEGMLEGIRFMAASIKFLANLFSKDNKFLNPKNLGRFLIFGNLFGQGLTVLGGLLKGSRHLIAGITTLGFGLARFFGGLGATGIAGGIIKFLDFFKNFGKIKGAADTAEEAAKDVATKSLNIKNYFGNILKALGGLVAVEVGALSIGGTVWAAVKMIKSIVKDLGTISDDMGDVDPEAMGTLAKWIGRIGGAFAALGGLTGLAIYGGAGGAVAALEGGILAVGGLITTISGIAWVNSKIIKSTLGNVVEAVDSVQSIVDGLQGLSGASIDVAGVKGMLHDLGELIPEMQLTYQGQYRETKLTPKKAKSMGEVFTHTATMFDGLKGAVDAIKGMGKIPDMSTTAERITPLVDGLGHIFGAMNTSFKGYKIDSKRAKDYAGIMSNVKSMFKTIGDISAMVPELQKNLASSVGTQSGRGSTPFTMLTNTLEDFFTGMGSIYQSMKDDFIWANGGAVGNNSGMFATAIQNAYNMFKTVGDIAKMIPTLQQQLGSIMGSASGGGGFYQLGSGLGNKGGSPFSAVTGQIKNMFEGLGEVVESLDANIPDTGGMVDKMTALVQSVNKIGEAANALNSLGTGALASADSGAFTAIDNIESMISRLSSALNVGAIASIATQVAVFKTSVEALMTSIQDIGAKPVEINITITARVKYSQVLSALRSARAKIVAAVNTATRPIRKTISITINRRVSVGGDAIPSAAALSHRQMGGLIYRARGGGVPWKRGTDTVPAMLSPGEFVHRKAAVDTFGIDFMRKVNNLDIAGAMRALSARAGANSAFARNTTINHNVTNNNNANVTQNINTSNPNFAFRRSNRYIGALT